MPKSKIEKVRAIDVEPGDLMEIGGRLYRVSTNGFGYSGKRDIEFYPAYIENPTYHNNDDRVVLIIRSSRKLQISRPKVKQ